MKFSKIALAAVFAAAAGQSYAAPEAGVFYWSGASAQSITAVKGLAKLCQRNAGATVHVYKTGTATGALGNQFTVACRDAANAAPVDLPNSATAAIVSSGFNEVRFDVSGGALTAVQRNASYTGTGALNAATSSTWLRSATAATPSTGCTTFTGTGALAATPNFVATLYTCATPSNQNGKEGMGGFMDVDGIQHGTSISGVNYATDFKGTGLRQAFGVGLNDTLYRALQTYQQSIGMIPATCTIGATTPTECQASISRAQVASLMAVTNGNVAHTTPAAFLIPGSATQVQTMYCRRPNTSGTQKAAELYFLHNVLGGGAAGGSQAIATPFVASALGGSGTHSPASGNAITGTRGRDFVTTENSGTSDVINCLGKNTVANLTGGVVSATTTAAQMMNVTIGTYNVAANPLYRFGIVSAENLPAQSGGVDSLGNPVALTSTWKFARLSEVPVTEGTATANNTATAAAGRYDFFFDAIQYCASGVCPPVVTAASAILPVGATSAGIFIDAETVFTRGSKSTNPVQSR